jgi:hypothetical protein
VQGQQRCLATASSVKTKKKKLISVISQLLGLAIPHPGRAHFGLPSRTCVCALQIAAPQLPSAAARGTPALRLPPRGFQSDTDPPSRPPQKCRRAPRGWVASRTTKAISPRGPPRLARTLAETPGRSARVGLPGLLCSAGALLRYSFELISRTGPPSYEAKPWSATGSG